MMDSDNDDGVFVTPPTSPVIHPLETDDSTELAEWKIEIIEQHLVKLSTTIKNAELDYKRIEALKSTKTKRWKAKVLEKKRKGTIGGRDSNLGVRSVPAIGKKEPSHYSKTVNKKSETSMDYDAGSDIGLTSATGSKSNGAKNHSSQDSVPNGFIVSVSGSGTSLLQQHQKKQSPQKSLNQPPTTTQAKGSIPILLTSVSSKTLPFSPVLVDNDSIKDNMFSLIRKEQTRQTEKLYEQIVEHHQTPNEKSTRNQTANSHTINNNNNYVETIINHTNDEDVRLTSGNGLPSYNSTPSTHFFQNQLPSNYTSTRSYDHYSQQNYSYQYNNAYQTDPYQAPASHHYHPGINNGAWTTPMPTAHQAYPSYSHQYHHQYPMSQYYSPVGDSTAQPPVYNNDRISPPPPPPPPTEPSPPVIPPPPPPPLPADPQPEPVVTKLPPPAKSNQIQPSSDHRADTKPTPKSTSDHRANTKPTPKPASNHRVDTKPTPKSTSAQTYSSAVLKKQKYQSPLATFGIQTDSTGPSSSKERAAMNQPLCIFEAEGGICNDDTCRSKHFRDF